jgi:hypothetical protein
LPAIDPPGAIPTRWIANRRVLDFTVELVPGRLIGGHNSLSRKLQEARKPQPEEEDDLEERIELSLHRLWVEQGSVRNRRKRP